MAPSEGSVVSVAHSASHPANGVSAEADDNNKVGYRVLLPPARYIPLSVTDLVDSIKSHIPHSHRSGEMLTTQCSRAPLCMTCILEPTYAQYAQYSRLYNLLEFSLNAQVALAVFNEICQLIEGKALTEFMGIRRRVKKNFRFFSAAAMHRDIPTRRGKGCASLCLPLSSVSRLRLLQRTVCMNIAPPTIPKHFHTFAIHCIACCSPQHRRVEVPQTAPAFAHRISLLTDSTCAVKKEDTMDEMEVVFLRDLWYVLCSKRLLVRTFHSIAKAWTMLARTKYQ